MEILIDKINLWSLEAQKYWSFPKSYSPQEKREQAKNMVLSNNFMGSRKMDGAWNMLIKDMDGNFHLRSRTESVNGGFTDKAEWIPHICEELSSLPSGTALLGEIYFPNNEGSHKITSVLNCLKDKCLDRQKKDGYLHFYIFDIIAYNGKSLINEPFEKRINHYINYELLDILKGLNYIEVAQYKEGQELWDLYGEVIAAGGEGIVITRKDCKYLPGKRTARMTLKMKKELEETIDAFIDGNYKKPEMESGTEHPESWQWWFNPKTGEKTDKCKYSEYCAGEPWVPIKKAAFYGWASAISFSVMKDGEPYHIGYISGIPDSMKEEIAKPNNSLIGKVYEINAMEIQHINGQHTLRHARIVGERADKQPSDCSFDQIAN